MKVGLEVVARFVRAHWISLLILGAMIGAWWILKTHGTLLASTEEFERIVQGGRPVVVEVFTSTCAPCLVAKSVVDGLERELGSQAEFVRVNAMGEVGAVLIRSYGVRATPTVLIFDGAGNVVYLEAGIPDRAAVREAIAQLTAQ